MYTFPRVLEIERNGMIVNRPVHRSHAVVTTKRSLHESAHKLGGAR